LRFFYFLRSLLNLLLMFRLLWWLLEVGLQFWLRCAHLFGFSIDVPEEHFLSLLVPRPDVPAEAVSPVSGALASPSVDEGGQVFRVDL
jgi:hypothetical protein